MIIIIGILAYILGFASCILVVRILIAKKKNDEIIKKAKQIIAKEKRKQKTKKVKDNKVVKLVEDIDKLED